MSRGGPLPGGGPPPGGIPGKDHVFQIPDDDPVVSVAAPVLFSPQVVGKQYKEITFIGINPYQ
jgi:hypothetical protein